MISRESIDTLIATYKKFGWEPRRLLLTAKVRELVSLSGEYPPVQPADIDAVWFSRPKQAGRVAWEIRHLGEAPFSLLEHLDEDSPGFEEQLKSIEKRLGELVDSRPKGN